MDVIIFHRCHTQSNRTIDTFFFLPIKMEVFTLSQNIHTCNDEVCRLYTPAMHNICSFPKPQASLTIHLFLRNIRSGPRPRRTGNENNLVDRVNQSPNFALKVRNDYDEHIGTISPCTITKMQRRGTAKKIGHRKKPATSEEALSHGANKTYWFLFTWSNDFPYWFTFATILFMEEWSVRVAFSQT